MSGCKCLERGVCFDGAAMRRLFLTVDLWDALPVTLPASFVESSARASIRAGKRIEFGFQFLQFETMRAIVVE